MKKLLLTLLAITTLLMAAFAHGPVIPPPDDPSTGNPGPGCSWPNPPCK